MGNKFNSKSTVVEINDVAEDIFSVLLKDENIPLSAEPGQFLMLKIDEDNHLPLLRRAISISKVIDENHYELLIQRVGAGTGLLRKKLVGQIISVLGPLGSSFNINKAKGKDVIIVAGGIGIAPVFFLYNSIKNTANSITIYYGGQSKKNIVDLKEIEPITKIATEDGSVGFKGYVTDLLLKDFKEDSFKPENSVIYSCGPTPMFKSLEKAIKNIPVYCEVSVETLMACGLGVCMGCPVA
ncbi:MAG: dihydroorotate dehydrogenase electron transfer subunit, partial [Calditrichia bacterium]|nr:dihydroorotate dehydrogenase electron transfer subunit [Calditrichia bacterium]